MRNGGWASGTYSSYRNVPNRCRNAGHAFRRDCDECKEYYTDLVKTDKHYLSYVIGQGDTHRLYSLAMSVFVRNCVAASQPGQVQEFIPMEDVVGLVRRRL